MKVYEYTKHRSIDLDPKDVNIERTRAYGRGFTNPEDYEDVGGKKWRGYELLLHDNTKYAWPHSLEGVLYVSEKTWKKVVNKPRKEW